MATTQQLDNLESIKQYTSKEQDRIHSKINNLHNEIDNLPKRGLGQKELLEGQIRELQGELHQLVNISKMALNMQNKQGKYDK